MKPIIYLAAFVFLIIYSNAVLALDESSGSIPITIDSTKGAKINIYCYENTSASVKEKPILLVHGFNSKGSVWRSEDEKKDYVNNLRKSGYDVIVVDMRGNPVDTDGDHKVDNAVAGGSWGYGVRDLGDDVGTALERGMDYLNKNLAGRNYKKADVITHSTGALAVTAYSRSLGLMPYRDNIGTVIELAPPNNGSTSLVANIKNIMGVIPSVFTQSMTAYQYALEVAENKIWIPGSRMESENLRRELSPDSMFLKSIQDLGPDKRIKTFIAIGSEDWVVGDWSPVIGERDDIGYEYFLGMDHFNFCSSETVMATILNKLEKGEASNFFNRFKPYKNKQLAFLSGPGIDHPDDTFDAVDFAKGVDISPAKLFDLYLRIAAKKNKAYMLKYWEILSAFKDAQLEISIGGDIDSIIDKWNESLGQKNKLLNDYYMCASREYLETPDIAVLANGYYNEMRKLIIEKAGEPVRIVDQTFEPYILDEQKVLVIPTGGLSGLSHSEIFRNKLSEYVKNGGILICFSQQYGYDFNALPGGKINAYGWQEDASCHAKAAYIENFHQVLSSQSELYPDIKLDGYFTDYPDAALILLRRSKNQMPAMLMYNFGKGIVIAASIYSDWGSLNGQAGSQEINLVRDLLRWAKSGGKGLPEYKTGGIFEQTIPVNRDFNKIEMILKSPEGEILEKTVSSGAVYESGLALEKPGIYSVDYILYGADSKPIQPQSEGIYFSFSLPPQGLPQNPDFTFDITTDSENYISGSEAVFTFHIRNNTSKDEQIRYKANLPHHKIEFTDVVAVPANNAVSFDKKITANTTDSLSSYFYSSQNVFIGKADRGVSVFAAGVEIKMVFDKDEYSPGEPAGLAVELENKSSVSLYVSAILDITDPDNNQIYYNSAEIALAELKAGSWPQSFTIPDDIPRGMCRAKLSAFSNSRLMGCKSVYFEIPKAQVDIGGEIDSYTVPGLNVDLILNLGNNYPKNQPISGSVEIRNKGDRIGESSLDIRVFPESDLWDLCGAIRDDKGAVVKGAAVGNVFTNKDGGYMLKNLNKGQAAINIKAPGFDSVSKNVDIFPGNNSMDVNLTPSKYGNLSGVIENSIGSAVSLEPVSVAGSDASARSGVTSADSAFKFKYLPVGNYLLTVSPGGISQDIQINEGENIFNAALNPAIYQDIEEIEPNSAFTNATEVNLNSRIRGRIYGAGDEDFFKFNITEKGVLYIKMYEVPQGLRPSIKIYDLSIPGRIISSKGGSANEKIILETEFDKPGPYCLLVRDWYGNISSLSNYSMNFNFIKTRDEYEPNETIGAARLIDFGKSYFATIAVKADSDFYKLSIPDAGRITVYLKDMPVNIRPYMKLYRDTGQVIDIKGGAAGEDVTMEFEVANPSNYYVQVYDRYNSESSSLRYRLLAYYVPANAYLPVDTAHFKKREDISNLNKEKRVNFDCPAIAQKGKYYIEAVFKSPVSQEIARFVRAFYIGDKALPALFKVSYLEDGLLSFNAGDNAEFRFRIVNEGGAKGSCDVNFRFRGLVNETQSALLEPGMEKEIAFKFLIPVDMEESGCEAEYEVDAETHKVNFNIIGVKVEALARVEGGIFKLLVKNLSPANGLKLFAEAGCGGYEKKIYFALNKEKDLEFDIPELSKREKVYYGIYLESGRSLYLNSYLISGEDGPSPPSIRIIKAGCGKDVYKDGESVSLNWKIESLEACPVKLSADLIKPDLDSVNIIEEEVNLEKGVNEITREISAELKQSGIYRVIYRFADIGQGSMFFDVSLGGKPKKNHEPVLFKIGEKEALAGDELEFFIEAMDIDGDMLIYSAETLPRGAGFDPWTKRFFWKPLESQTGEYFVTFIVSDGKARASERVKITVSEPVDIPPEAIVAIAEPASGIAPLEVSFNSQSLNKYKKIVKYEWDFDGKGVYDFSSPESGEAVFIYTGEGSFPAALRLTDKNGITNTYAAVINVEKNPDAPGAYLDATPLKGVAPCRVFFRGGAFCPQGIAKYEWDFDGDGVFDASSLKSGEVVKTYGLSGKYDAEFKVTSVDGLSGSRKVLIEVDDPKAFSVKSSALPISGNVPLEVSFEIAINGSGPFQKYQWDFEGDGVFDYTSLNPGVVKHTYCEPGVYKPTALATDINNLSGQAESELRLSVSDPDNIKKGRIIVNPKKGRAPLAVRFSFETEDAMNDGEYLWDFDDDGIVDLVASTPQAEFIYDSPGVYTAKVDVRTADGVVISCHETIYITNGNNNDKRPVISSNSVARDKIGKIELADKTSLILPADALEQDDIVNIKKLESSQIQKEIDLSKDKSLGEYREYKFENRKGPLNKEMVISIPYIDKDEDGIVDDRDIDELTLNVYWYDEDNTDWKILSDALIFPKENIVTVKTSHFTIFGIAGVENRKENTSQSASPAIDSGGSGAADGGGGSGGSCFIATAAFGSPMAREVVALREFRDKYLLRSESGRRFVGFYYYFSPPIAEFIKTRPLTKSFIRYHIKLLVSLLRSIL